MSYQDQPVEDTDNLNQKMQIRSINQARQKVRDVRNTAQEQIASASAATLSKAERGGSQVYLQVVKAYALEFAPLVAQHDEKLWSEETILKGAWENPEPDTKLEVLDVDPEAAAVEITGIAQFLSTQFPVSARYQVTLRDSGSGEKTVTRQSTWVPTFAEIDSVLLALDQSRSRLGLYLEGPDERDLDYNDPDTDDDFF